MELSKLFEEKNKSVEPRAITLDELYEELFGKE